jgi:hypothetical protein
MVELPKKGEAGAGTGQPIVEGDNHMKKTFAVVAMAAVLGACAEGPMDPMDGPLFSKGAAAPNTAITGTIEVATATIRESGASNNGNGTCETGGAFRNNGGNLAPTVPHEQCMSTGTPREVSLTFRATYVLAGSGNVQLNFGNVCDPDEPAACSDTFLRFHKNSDASSGAGTLFGNDGGVWEILLGNVSDTDNIIVPGVRVPALHGGEHYVATLNW